MEDHCSLRNLDGEDDKLDREVSSILLELSHPVFFSYDSSPCPKKWGCTKQRSTAALLPPPPPPPPEISPEPVTKPQQMTEVVGEVGSNTSSSCLTGEAKKTNPQTQTSEKGSEEEEDLSRTYLKLKPKISSQPSASCPVLEIKADTGVSRAQAVAPPAQPIAEKGRMIRDQNLRPLRPLMIRAVDRTAPNVKQSETVAAMLLEARNNMERRGFDMEPRNNGMERVGFHQESTNNVMKRRGYDLDPRNNNVERRELDMEPRHNNMERVGFHLESSNKVMERRGFEVNPRNNDMERRGFEVDPRTNNIEWYGFDVEARNDMKRRRFELELRKYMEGTGFDQEPRHNNTEGFGFGLEARINNMKRRVFDQHFPAIEELNHRIAEMVEIQRVAEAKKHQQDAAQARKRRLGLMRSKKLLRKNIISPK